MQWRQHEHGHMQQDAELMSIEQEAAQHCCSADCPAEEEQEDEAAFAHKVATELLCMITGVT